MEGPPLHMAEQSPGLGLSAPSPAVPSPAACAGDTYNRIAGHAELEWILERARVLRSMENEMTSKEREQMQTLYWVQDSNGRPCFQVQEVGRRLRSRWCVCVRRRVCQAGDEFASPASRTMYAMWVLCILCAPNKPCPVLH